MKLLPSILCAVVCAVALVGCVPERVVWSPDGTEAVVLGEDGVHLCDADGTIGPALAPGSQAVDGKVAQWLPDGKGVVVLQEEKLATWKMIEGAYPEEAKGLAADKEALDKAREMLLAAAGKPAEEFVKAIQPTVKGMKGAWPLIYLRDNEGASLQGKLGSNWGALGAFSSDGLAAEVYRLKGKAAEAGPVLWHGDETLVTLRVSPNGRAVAVVQCDEQGNEAALTIVSTDGSGRVNHLGSCALYPDWSRDGNDIYCIIPVETKTENGDKGRFGTLVRRKVVADAGVIVESGGIPDQEALVGLVFDVGLRVRTASDGRVFFVAPDITLPTTPVDMDSHPTLFSISPGKQATVTRVVPRNSEGAMGDALQFFDISPDDSHISVPFQDGRVSVLDLATGKVDEVQPLEIGGSNGSNDQDRLTSIPTWRPGVKGGELTFVRPKEKNGKAAEVVRYSLVDGSVVVLSAKWGAGVKAKWIGP